jgi:hypothetical protein
MNPENWIGCSVVNRLLNEEKKSNKEIKTIRRIQNPAFNFKTIRGECKLPSDYYRFIFLL